MSYIFEARGLNSSQLVRGGFDLTVESGERVALFSPDKDSLQIMFDRLRSPIPPLRVFALGKQVEDSFRDPLTGIFPESLLLDEELTPYDHLIFFSRLLGLPKKDTGPRIRWLLRFIGIDEFESRPISMLKVEAQWRVQLIRCFLNSGWKFVLAFEPLRGFNSQEKSQILSELFRFNETSDRGSLVFTDNPTDAALLAQRILLCQGDKILAEGTLESLIHTHCGPFKIHFKIPYSDVDYYYPRFSDRHPVTKTHDGLKVYLGALDEVPGALRSLEGSPHEVSSCNIADIYETALLQKKVNPPRKIGMI